MEEQVSIWRGWQGEWCWSSRVWDGLVLVDHHPGGEVPPGRDPEEWVQEQWGGHIRVIPLGDVREIMARWTQQQGE